MTFEELGASQCRWPVAGNCDEAEWCSFQFCGEAVARKGGAHHVTRVSSRAFLKATTCFAESVFSGTV
jgi:hypothetical protein